MASGEKPLFWIGSSLVELISFPEAVKDELGAALSIAQFGGKHPSAKPWKGLGAGVVKFAEALYVLHAFQKKSPTGIKTRRRDVELIRERLKLAQADYEARHGI